MRSSNNQVSMWLDNTEYVTSFYDYSAYTTDDYFFVKNSDLVSTSDRGAEFDDVAIRLYLEPEPSAPLGTEEQASKGIIPMNAGTPFYTTSSNPHDSSSVGCLANMISGDSCETAWEVNATGDEGSTWLFFATYASMNYTANVSEARTSIINLTIIGNVQPTVQTTSLSPAVPTDLQDLNCTFNVTDPNAGDTLTVNVSWYRDNAPAYSVVMGVDAGVTANHMLGAGNTSTGEDWRCGVTPSDDYVSGDQMNTSNVTVISAFGSINATLFTPNPNGTTEYNVNTPYLANASVACLGQSGQICGRVNATLRYESGSGWWNASFRNRCKVTLTETRGYERTHEPVIINGSHLESNCGGSVLSAMERSIRVTDSVGNEIVSQVDDWINDTDLNDSDDIFDSNDELVFLANITSGGTASFYVYYDTSFNDSAAYADALSVSSTSLTRTIIGDGWNGTYDRNDGGGSARSGFADFWIANTEYGHDLYAMMMPRVGSLDGVDEIFTDEKQGPVRYYLRVVQPPADSETRYLFYRDRIFIHSNYSSQSFVNYMNDAAGNVASSTAVSDYGYDSNYTIHCRSSDCSVTLANEASGYDDLQLDAPDDELSMWVTFNESSRVADNNIINYPLVQTFGNQENYTFATIISNVTGTSPFYTVSPQPQSCGVMTYGDICYVNWSVYATGTLGSNWKLDAFFESNISTLNTSATADAFISITNNTPPVLTNLTVAPAALGYGYDVNITVTVTDDENATDRVLVNITVPDEGTTTYTMTNTSLTGYLYTFNNTWRYGTYNVTVFANDSHSATSRNSTTFQVTVRGEMETTTLNSTYGPNELVDLLGKGTRDNWWNTSFGYRKPIIVTNNDASSMAGGYVIEISLNTTELVAAGKLQPDCDDLRFVWYNDSSGMFTELDRINKTACNSSETKMLFATAKPIAGSSQDGNYTMYYGNGSVGAGPQNESRIYPLKDDFNTANGNPPGWTVVSGTWQINNNKLRGTNPSGINAGAVRGDTAWTDYNFTVQMTSVAGGTRAPGPIVRYQDSNNYWWFESYGGSLIFRPKIGGVDQGWVQSFSVSSGFPVVGTEYNLTIVVMDQHVDMWVEGTRYVNYDVPVAYQISAGSVGLTQHTGTGETVDFDNALVLLRVNASPSTTLDDEQTKIGLKSYILNKNTGSNTFKGYLLMRVQRLISSVWTNIDVPVVEDLIPPVTTRIFTPGTTLYLNTTWANEGSWNTLLRTNGTYRVLAQLTDPTGSFVLKRNVNDDFEATAPFTIGSPTLRVQNLTHENLFDHAVNEYEGGDTIGWINITIINQNTTAVGANITLNVSDYLGQQVTWGPHETQSCGTLLYGETCTRRFDNSSSGYGIPLDASPGTYDFSWNVMMSSAVGNPVFNSSNTFQLHYLPANFTSTIDPVRIYQNQSVVYNFTFFNPWSRNLTKVNVTVPCPDINGISCTCLGTSLTYCSLDTVGNRSTVTASFNISTNASTPLDTYYVNATLNYTNPGGEVHVWTEQQRQEFRVSLQGILETTITNAATTVTRNRLLNLSGFTNNTDTTSANGVNLTWTLPGGWTNLTGGLVGINGTLGADRIYWHNITSNISLQAPLGSQTVYLRSNASDKTGNTDSWTIDVYAQPQVVNLISDNYDPVQGDTISLQATLRWDNNTPLEGVTLTMADMTANITIGSDTTDAGGIVFIDYNIPSDSSVGNHSINASFAGIPSRYLRSASNTTIITVHQVTNISDVQAAPWVIGYGRDVVISANVTDGDGLLLVRANVTLPNGSSSWRTMSLSGGLYTVTFNDTWLLGSYNFSVWSNDTTGEIGQSAGYRFNVSVQGSLRIDTQYANYTQNTQVNLTSNPSFWWNPDYLHRKRINVTNNDGGTMPAGYTMNLSVDTATLVAAGKMNSNCSDLRLTFYNTSTSKEVALDRIIENSCNQTNTLVSFRIQDPINPSASDTDYYLYYGNGDPGSPPENKSNVYYFWDPFNYSDGTLPNWDVVTGTWTTYQDTLRGTNPSGQNNMGAKDGNESWINYTLEVKMKSVAGSTRAPGPIVRAADNDNYWWLENYNGQIVFRPKIGGTDQGWIATFTVFSGYPVVNTWYNLTVQALGDHINMWVDGTQYVNYDVNPADNVANGMIGFTQHTGTGEDVQFDDAKVTLLMGTSPSGTLGSEKALSSALIDGGPTNFSGYLYMKVQFNNSGTWQDKSIIVDDVANLELRVVNASTFLGLNPFWIAGGAWNTGLEENGAYRVYAELTDRNRNLLTDDDGSALNASAEFLILPPNVNLETNSITIYDVTGAANTHTNISSLIATGLNTTFDLFTNRTYRIEIAVNVQTDSSDYVINSSNVSHSFLNQNWVIDQATDIWYVEFENTYTGGNLSSQNVTWNTSLGGTVSQLNSVTFYYVVNITPGTGGDYPVRFAITNPSYQEEDRSHFNVIESEQTPPALFDGIYSLSPAVLHRGEPFTIYARWQEMIKNASIEFNGTSASLQNTTLTLPDPNPDNWTNMTITTNASWLLGTHAAKLFAWDANDNLNNTLPYRSVEVWGYANISQTMINDSVIDVNGSISFSCQVMLDNGSPSTGYNVTFFNGTEDSIGTALTNATGWASITYTDGSAGLENLTCNISHAPSLFLNRTAPYSALVGLKTLEGKAPWWSGQNQTTDVAHKGDTVYLWADWFDNLELDQAVLSSNETGSFLNNSLTSALSLSGNESVANFTVSLSTTMNRGPFRWKIHANDTSDNWNVTAAFTLTVWGWAETASISLSPASMFVTNTTTILCRVIDANSSAGIGNYNVSFYNGSNALIGTSLTNASGYAQMNYTDNSSGIETITCNISDWPTAYYNASSANSRQDDLNTLPNGFDIYPPITLSYGMSDYAIIRGENTTIYAQWNETINRSQVQYNGTATTLETFNVSEPFPGNWTNHTILTNQSWLPGRHAAKLIAWDQNQNKNDTLPYLWFNVSGYSKVFWHAPRGSVVDELMNMTCNVSDRDLGGAIADYPVYFYNGSFDFIGLANTDSLGQATVTVNVSGKTGTETYYCQINDESSLFYVVNGVAGDDQSSQSILFGDQAPSVSLQYPGSGYNSTSTTIPFNFTAIDDYDTNMTCNLSIDGSVVASSITAPNNTMVNRSVSGIGQGAHTWNVTCWDSNPLQGYSATRSFTVDSLPPTITVMTPPDHYWHTANVTFQFNVSDQTGVQNCSLILDGTVNQTLNSSELSDPNNFTLTDLTEGAYRWNITCIDSFSQVSSSPLRNFTIDRTVPGITLHDPANGTLQHGALIVFNFTATDNLDTDLLCNITSDGSVLISQISAQNGSATNVSHDYGFEGVGIHHWNVTCLDNATNLKVSETWWFNITVIANISLVGPANGSWHQKNVNFTYLPKDINGLDNCTLWIDGVVNKTVSPITNYNENTIGLENISEGPHNWTMACYNSNADLRQANQTWWFNIDRSAPTITIHDPADGNVTDQTSVSFNFTATDNMGTPLLCNLTLDGQVNNTSPISAPNGTPTNLTVSGINDGTHHWNITCLDNASNSGTSPTRNFTINVPPTVTLENPGNGSYQNSSTVIFTYTPTDGENLTSCNLIFDQTINLTNTTITNGGMNNFTLGGIDEGKHSWTVNCTDPANNVGTATARVLTVDTTRPNVTLIDPPDGNVTNSSTILFRFNGTDNIATTLLCNLTLDGQVNNTASIS
ncbi:MAG: DUF4861 domain-containing protein, partial [DPANN group archaeon]|nr:DUF4861 domain-containing protein [DPANN group archaeon]